jgi:hypothetical protein
MIAPDKSISRAVELVSAVQPLVPTGRLVGLCWLMLIGLAGCGSGHQEPAMQSVAAAQSTGSISVSTGPVARLSEMVDAQLLPLEIRDAVRLDDGGIAYASGRELVIRIVSGDGDPAIAEVGRGGEGPGEFKALQWLENCGRNELYAWDFVQSRVTVFGVNGELLRQFNLPMQPITSMYCNLDGTMLALETPREALSPPGSELEPLSARAVVIGPTGKVQHEIAGVPMGRNRPLGPVTTGGVISDYLVIATAELPNIEFTHLNGESVQVVPLGEERHVATKEVYEAAIEHIVSQATTSVQDRVREVLQGIPMPEYLPAYRSVATDKQRFVWVAMSQVGEGVSRFIVVDGHPVEGAAIVGSVEFPFEADLLEVGSDYLLLHTREATGDDVLIYSLAVSRYEPSP